VNPYGTYTAPDTDMDPNPDNASEMNPEFSSSELDRFLKLDGGGDDEADEGPHRK
jgi:hypothetical protein